MQISVLELYIFIIFHIVMLNWQMCAMWSSVHESALLPQASDAQHNWDEIQQNPSFAFHPAE